MSNTNNQGSARLVYMNGLEIVKEAGLDPKVVKLTQSSLRLENTISITRSNYLFAVLVNAVNNTSNQVFNSEIRLNQQDSFIASQIRFYIGEPSSLVDVTWVDYTYPSPVVFAAVGESAALETLYKGQLKITVNNVVVLPTMSLSRFRKVPFAQKATAAANQNGIGDDSIDSSSDGISITEPNIILVGSKNSIVEINLPAAVGVISAAGFTRMGLEFRGLLAQNSTIIT